MNALSSLLKKHRPLGIYNITENSNIYFELASYAEGLDMLTEVLETQLSECFCATASTFGLEAMERLWGKVRDDLSAQKRREMLLLRSSFGFDDFTLEGAKKLVSFLGLDAKITEYPKAQRIVIDTTGKSYSVGQQNWIVAQLEALLPAHLEIDIVWEGFDFDTMDNKNYTFDSMDAKNLTWSEIDIYKEM